MRYIRVNGGSWRNDVEWGLAHAYSQNNPEDQTEEPSNIFQLVADLSETERDGIKTDLSEVQKACAALHIGRAVTSNRNKFLEFLVKTGMRFLNDPKAFNDGFDATQFEMSRRLMNLCASFRAYLEHQETYFKRELGRKSPEFASWASLLKAVEQDNSSYALLYGLRNYIQHVDMPPLAMSVSSTDRESVSLSLDLMRKDLLTPTAQWSDEMRKYLSSCGEKISVWEVLEGWDEAFRAIQRKNVEFRIFPARPAAMRILNIRQQLNIPPFGMIGMMPIPTKKADGGISLSIEWIEEGKARTIIRVCDSLGSDEPIDGRAAA